jgi:8-oxo-dGTP diphosphatase
MKIATLAIILNNGKVLLGYKKKGEIGTGTINGPGGKKEEAETLIECLVRETLEEVGIHLSPMHLVETAIITFHAGGIPDFKVHVFRTEVFSGKPIETKDMIPEWYDIDDLPLDRMLESDQEWFTRAINGERFNANVYYKERAKSFEKIEFFPYKPL